MVAPNQFGPNTLCLAYSSAGRRFQQGSFDKGNVHAKLATTEAGGRGDAFSHKRDRHFAQGLCL